MSKSARLRLSDLRGLYQLVGECRDLGDDAAGWRSRFTSGLGLLTGASYAAALDTVFQAGRLAPTGAGEWGELDRKVLRQVQTDHGADLRFSPLIDAYLARPEAADGSALCRTDLVGEREWLGSPYYRIVHEPLRIGHNLVSFLALPGATGQCSGITLTRPAAERREFTAREKLLVCEANAAVAALIGGPLAGFAEPSPSGLPPRARAVLRCLLEGDGDKQTAARLRISPYTVNVHVKAIFRHFGVRSRAELLARWVRRGWGGRCAWADPD